MDMASRWLGDPEAKDRLVRSAEEHYRKGRYTLAGICMLGATVNGTVKDFLFMEEIAGLRQGPLAELSRTVAVGSRKKDAAIMLEAAGQAAALELDAVQARCAALAFDFAKGAGLSRQRQRRLQPCWRASRSPCRRCPSCRATRVRC